MSTPSRTDLFDKAHHTIIFFGPTPRFEEMDPKLRKGLTHYAGSETFIEKGCAGKEVNERNFAMLMLGRSSKETSVFVGSLKQDELNQLPVQIYNQAREGFAVLIEAVDGIYQLRLNDEGYFEHGDRVYAF